MYTIYVRLVVCGYSQIPSVDFQEHFAPVVNDVSYWIMMALMMSMGMKAKIVEIKMAFLHGDLEEEIFDCQFFQNLIRMDD